MAKVAVVILNWNGKDLLEKFLPAVLKFSPSWAEIIVADNASSDDSVKWLRENHSSVRIIQNEMNGGYAKGYNDALKKTDAEFYVLLNSDVEVTEGWIGNVIALMEKEEKIGACQPSIRSYHEKEKFEYAGAAGGFIDKWGYPFCRGRVFDTYEKDSGQYNDDCEVFWATGACLFVRSKAYHEMGGFDEDFFAHMEEIDLCWRMRNRGWSVMYCGSSVVFHIGGGTLAKQSPKKTFLNFRNNLVLLCKNHAPGYFWLKIFLRMCLDGIASVKFFFSGDFAHAWAVQRAHMSFYAHIGRTLRKRKTEKKNIRHYATACIYEKTLVMEYFFRGKKKFSDLDKNKFSK
ncbi:MAG: glycosyltransferase family 2 protein [Bacteroidetes bacterium]|nr:glycosyltransferase family 2 protein [Bacteroidota bacterium]